MKIAVCVIAVCSVVRILQNGIQLAMLAHSKRESEFNFDKATEAFAENMRKSSELEAEALKKWVDLKKSEVKQHE